VIGRRRPQNGQVDDRIAAGCTTFRTAAFFAFIIEVHCELELAVEWMH
jgi:hypothetical protein